jgi:hypothetical protein
MVRFGINGSFSEIAVVPNAQKYVLKRFQLCEAGLR